MQFIVNHSVYTPVRIFCIGQNYIAHIRELKNEVPDEPVVFQKPFTSLVLPGEKVKIPTHGKNLHHEVEVVVLIGKEGKAYSVDEASSFVAGVSLGLDLTLRDVQTALRKKGLPWEAAKAFEQSAPIGEFTPFGDHLDLKNISFECRVNGEVRQKGNTSNMIFSIEMLIYKMSKIWRFRPGDVIYTGTPEGVAPLNPGDKITIFSPDIGEFEWEIVS